MQETQRLARDPFLADRFRDGVGGGEGDSFRNFDLARFVDRVGLRSLERLVLAAAIVGGQTRKELTTQAVGVIRTEFDNAVPELCQSPPFEHAEFTPAQMSKILSNLLVDHSQDAPLLEDSQRQALLIAAQSKLGKEAMTPILQRLYPKLRYLLYTRICHLSLICLLKHSASRLACPGFNLTRPRTYERSRSCQKPARAIWHHLYQPSSRHTGR